MSVGCIATSEVPTPTFPQRTVECITVERIYPKRSISPVYSVSIAEMAFREAFCTRLIDRCSLACLYAVLPQRTGLHVGVRVPRRVIAKEEGTSDRRGLSCGVTFVSGAALHVSFNVPYMLSVRSPIDGSTKE